jgi:uncharacterized protein (TIGR03083 family)
VLATLADERRRLVADLRGLTDEQWQTPSLCAGWTVHHVLAHLTTAFAMSPPRIAAQVLRSRSVPAAMDALARDVARRGPQELLDLLEARATSTRRPPGLPLAAPLTDAVAHGTDIRWALSPDRADTADPQRLRPVLRFLTSPRAAVAFVPRGRLGGLRLEATDLGWTHGTGAPVRGPALAVAMAALGRPSAREQLHGDGVPLLLSRF